MNQSTGELLKVAAIVPAHNEEGRVGDVVQVLVSSGMFSQVVVVDDGSSDRLAQRHGLADLSGRALGRAAAGQDRHQRVHPDDGTDTRRDLGGVHRQRHARAVSGARLTCKGAAGRQMPSLTFHPLSI